jgi:hypothetical protein
MAATHVPALSAIAFQLVATLEHYEQDLDALLLDWPDTQRYEAIRRHMDNIQMYSSSVPSLAVSAVALLISHSELVFTLWRGQPGSRPAGDELLRVRADHRGCVASLRRHCLRELSRGEHATMT